MSLRRRDYHKTIGDNDRVDWPSSTPVCVPKVGMLEGAWQDSDDGATRSKYSFIAQDSPKFVKIEVRRLEELTQGYSVERKLANGEWFFIFNGIDLGIALSASNATEENFRTYDLLAVENVLFWSGKIVSGGARDETWGVDGSAFRWRYKLANNKINYTYTFDKERKTLIGESIDDDLSSPMMFTCDRWKKQRWYDF